MLLKNLNANWRFEANPESASSQPVESQTDESAEEPSSDATESEDNSGLFSEMTDHYEGESSAETYEGRDSQSEEEVELSSDSTPAPSSEEGLSPSPSPEETTTSPESQEVTATQPETPIQPQPTAEETPTPTVAPEQPAQLTQEEMQAKLEEHRNTVLPQLQERYKLDENTVAELEANPANVLPQLLAQMHYDVTQAIFSGVMSQVPQVVGQQYQQMQKQSELESKFFGKYPGLRDHPNEVQQALTAAMQSGLAKTYDEVEQLAATMTAIKLKTPIEQLMGQDAPATPSTPKAAPAPANVARPIAPSATGAPMTGQPREQKDIWGDMVEFELQQSG